ncbi:hypothetical protein M513_07600 [Trichuris suis]|uniref:Uncharacterized protein n=1 Tax=Trichuris suis TaxID=68888 RepID=A0A085M2V4_9BILA|nr:hypothetical protein M513_07600 [Trichuris suis]
MDPASDGEFFLNAAVVICRTGLISFEDEEMRRDGVGFVNTTCLLPINDDCDNFKVASYRRSKDGQRRAVILRENSDKNTLAEGQSSIADPFRTLHGRPGREGCLSNWISSALVLVVRSLACFGTMSFHSHSECEHIFDCSVRHCTNELTMEGITVKVKEKRKNVG